jgi:hypothetical protein
VVSGARQENPIGIALWALYREYIIASVGVISGYVPFGRNENDREHRRVFGCGKGLFYWLGETFWHGSAVPH